MMLLPQSPPGVQQGIQIPCSPVRIATAWYYALTEDYPEASWSPETLQQFIRLTQWGCAALQRAPVDTEKAAVIGASLIDMGFDQPASLGRTISIWSSHLLDAVTTDTLLVLYPLLQELLQVLADGFMKRLQETTASRATASAGPHLHFAPDEQPHARPNPSVLQRSMPALSPNDTTMLRLLMAGKTNREISMLLMISEKAVEKRLTKLFATLNVKSRTEAIAWAIQMSVS